VLSLILNYPNLGNDVKILTSFPKTQKMGTSIRDLPRIAGVPYCTSCRPAYRGQVLPRIAGDAAYIFSTKFKQIFALFHGHIQNVLGRVAACGRTVRTGRGRTLVHIRPLVYPDCRGVNYHLVSVSETVKEAGIPGGGRIVYIPHF
jgi:hypothetical protein